MTDAFLVLMQPGAGDELQGIKKGILELADLIVVNKADGEAKQLAEFSRRHYQNALNLLTHTGFWTPQVLSISALKKDGLNELQGLINQYRSEGHDAILERRKTQNGLVRAINPRLGGYKHSLATLKFAGASNESASATVKSPPSPPRIKYFQLNSLAISGISYARTARSTSQRLI